MIPWSALPGLESSAGVIAATIFQFPHPITNYPAVLSAAVLVVGPAILMVSRLRFRSFKTINFGRGPSYIPVLMFVLFVALIYSEPQWTLMILAYGYMVSGQVLSRVRAGRSGPPPAASES